MDQESGQFLSEKERLCRLEKFELEEILSAVRTRGAVCVRGANAAAQAILLAEAGKALGRQIVIVAADQKIVEQQYENLKFFVSNAGRNLVMMPEIQTKMYAVMAQNRRQTGERMRALHRLDNERPQFVFTSVENLMRRCMPRDVLSKETRLIRTHDTLDPEQLCRELLALGYVQAPEVDTPGTFAIHCGIADIFSPAHETALRIEFFGDEIDAIRAFDVETQRTLNSRADAILTPASEIILRPENIEHATECAAQWADQNELPSKILRQTRESIEERVLYWGIQATMPAYYERTDALFDYLSDDAVILWLEPDLCLDAAKTLAGQFEKQFLQAAQEQRFICTPSELMLSPEECTRRIWAHKVVFTGLSLEFPEKSDVTFRLDTLDNGDIVLKRKQMSLQRGEDFLQFLAQRFLEWLKIYGELAIVAQSPGTLERLKTYLRPLSVPVRVSARPFDLSMAREAPCESITLYTGTLSSGCRCPAKGFAIVTESEIFGVKTHRKPAKKLEENHALASFRDLKTGDYVVHADHGIGQYQGLMTMEAGGIVGDFLLIQYADAGKLYIPVQRLKSVQKYAGAEKPQRLDKLGGGAWERTKDKVRQNVKKLAIDLLDLYAKRQSRTGFAFSQRDPFFRAFEDDFPYEETPDQAKAIEAVLHDMHRAAPMERLICGDVGFGKTEVAMRAAMRAVLDGKQVAVLVPTTILAEQHYANFLKRFANHPVTIRSLNRFRKPKEIKEILADLAIGKVDIVIGTHRLLSKDVIFKSLGLLIVDEEHRFGVAHKEKIKALSEGIDCLTMTATPIPRTFQMCIGGLKDLSVIETPPSDRLAIHTHVAKFSETLIAQAIEQELARGGQVYFLHNRVEELGIYEAMIQKLVPRVRITVAHGQMDEKSLEQSMLKFIHHEADLLLCTTIIESGIDIPSANCLIVSHAERFGLAQLYQIRGRVGRSSERAYCYLLTGNRECSDIARQRLQAIERLTELGSGLEIAYLDLEMRGCGNLLGAEQSGNIASVGLEMYAELMQEAVDSIQGISPSSNAIESEVNLPMSAYLSQDYIEDVQMRLLFYKRMANAETIDKLYEIFGEIIDRYGSAPQEAKTLKDTFELKIMLADMGIQSMDANYTSIILTPGDNSKIDPIKLVNMISAHPKQYAFRQDKKLIRYLSKDESGALLETAAIYLDDLKKQICS